MDSLYVHLFVGFTIRIVFITYGIIQDSLSEVQFTDVDYKVFTDAARHILNGESPYNRVTYRYPPLIAFLMVPNILCHPSYGKIILSISDLLVFVLLYRILRMENLSRRDSIKYSLFWLYNPLSIVITTRGNADSVAALFVVLTLYFFQKKNYAWAGVFHGLSIHLRLYPVVFSLPLYLSIKDNRKGRLAQMFYPNFARIKLVFFCLMCVLLSTSLCYWLYGYEYLNESFLFHLTRHDIRHNYSAYFYLSYLTFGDDISIFQKLVTAAPALALILVFSFHYGNKKDLPFCEMCVSFVLVMYNSVITCQYFVWYMSLLPLSLPKMYCSWKELFLVSNFWFLSQAAWLLPSYLLEFKSFDTYLHIWIMCLVFFWANVVVLTSMIRNYNRKKGKLL